MNTPKAMKNDCVSNLLISNTVSQFSIASIKSTLKTNRLFKVFWYNGRRDYPCWFENLTNFRLICGRIVQTGVVNRFNWFTENFWFKRTTQAHWECCLYSAASFHFVSTKSSECHEKRIEFYMKQMNLNLAMFYYVSCCTSRSSPEMKCPVSGAKRLMLYCT